MDRVRRKLVLGLAAAPLTVPAGTALPPEVAAELPGARLLGGGRLSFLGLHIYDARLWIADSFSAERFDSHALAIELQYARTLYGRLIAERSLEEMKRVGGFSEEQGERWLAAMKQTFPDVGKGDRITGVQQPQEAARFFHNGGLRGELRDAEFTRRFFGIWLAPQTSEPRLRQSLLGAALPRSVDPPRPAASGIRPSGGRAGSLMDLRAAHYGIRPSGGRAASSTDLRAAHYGIRPSGGRAGS